MEVLVILLIIICLLVAVIFLGVWVSNTKKQPTDTQKKSGVITYKDINEPEPQEIESDSIPETELDDEKFPYLLTQSVFSPKEKLFYMTLKPIADELDLIVFSKMRMADILYLPRNTKDYIKWFNYIKAKHVDFILCDQNMKIKLLIEVDDKTHNRDSRKKRDEFVDKIFNQQSVNVLHVWSWGEDIKEKIVNCMNS